MATIQHQPATALGRTVYIPVYVDGYVDINGISYYGSGICNGHDVAFAGAEGATDVEGVVDVVACDDESDG